MVDYITFEVINAIVSLLGPLKPIWTGIKAARSRSQAPPTSNPSLNLSNNRSMRRLVSPAANDSPLNLSQAKKVLTSHRAKLRSNLH